MGYLLTDQAYAVSITRWTQEADDEAAGGPPAAGLERKVPYYLGAAVLLWANWQVCTIIGILIGSACQTRPARLRGAPRVPRAARAAISSSRRGCALGASSPCFADRPGAHLGVRRAGRIAAGRSPKPRAPGTLRHRRSTRPGGGP
jgi:hypothetical protein